MIAQHFESQVTDPGWTGENSFAWMAEGVCGTIDPEKWFPLRGDKTGSERAKNVCHTCLSEARCLEWALGQKRGVAGVFGGTTEAERRELRRAS